MSTIIRHTELISTKLLKPYNKNQKKHTPEQLDRIKKSIEMGGFVDPIIVNNLNEKLIIAGHARVKVAKEMGIESLPVVSFEDLSEAQQKAFRILHNKSGEAEWDFNLLKEAFTDLEEANFDLDLTGFGFDEIAGIMNIKPEGSDIEAQEDEFDTERAAKEPKYKVNCGEVWQLGNHRLMCGDSIVKEEVHKLIGEERFRLCLTDPPYNLGYKYNDYKDNKPLVDYKKWCSSWFNLAKSSSVIQIITTGNQNIGMWHEIEYPKWIMCWHKPNGQSGCKLRGLNKWEPIMVYFNDKIDRIIPEDTYSIQTGYLSDKDDGMRKLHTCPKPTKLFGSIIKDYTDIQNNVLDLFGGSGTTLIVCEQMQRVCYMMEIDPIYCSVIIERWEKLTGQKAIKL